MRAGRWEFLGWACALAVLATACGGGGAPARGFGSRQVLATRDPTFRLDDEIGADKLIGSTGEPSGTGRSYVSIDLSTGKVEQLGSTYAIPPFVPPDGTGRFACAWDSTSGKTVLTIMDTQSGGVTSIDGITGQFPSCPLEPDQILFVWRSDDAGVLTLWAGPYDQLARVATDLVIYQLVYSGSASTLNVLAARSADPGASGIFSIDKATFVTGEVIPPAIGGAAFADGAPPGGALTSGTLSNAFPVMGLGDHFFYARVMSDGTLLAFVGPMAAGPARELALFPTHAPPTLAGINAGQFADHFPALLESSATGSLLRYWDDARRRVVSCDLPPSVMSELAGIATRDGRRLLFEINRDPNWMDVPGPLLLVSLDLAPQGGACSLLAPANVVASGFFPDDGSMFWVAAPPGGDATLWSAHADGSAARQIGSAASIEHVHFLDNSRLEFALGQDLVWLDLREGAPSLHYIAEHVFGDSIDLVDLGDFFGVGAGGKSLVTGYDYNQQDDNGMLGVVDRETGNKRAISPAVTWYRQWYRPLHFGGIVYFVRGRNPSAQDGLWVATLVPADLQ